MNVISVPNSWQEVCARTPKEGQDANSWFPPTRVSECCSVTGCHLCECIRTVCSSSFDVMSQVFVSKIYLDRRESKKNSLVLTVQSSAAAGMTCISCSAQSPPEYVTGDVSLQITRKTIRKTIRKTKRKRLRLRMGKRVVQRCTTNCWSCTASVWASRYGWTGHISRRPDWCR